MQVSTDFAPPFKLIAPYFIIGVLTFGICMALLFSVDIHSLHYLNNSILAWVHLFLLGFVMMVIFGAMAQLVPVVLEVGHFAVELYYIIYPLLIVGTLMMVFGFWHYPLLLSFGGVVAFIAFGVFLFETFLTIVKVKKINFVIFTVLVANIFLFFGLIVGIVLALGYAGLIVIDILSFLSIHVFLVFIGYVCVTIMGMSLVLLPMFWLSHDFSWKYVKSALGILIFSIMCVSFGSLFAQELVSKIGYFFIFVALSLYFLQVFIIYKKRVRMERDIYLKSMLFSYFSLFVALCLGGYYLLNPSVELLLVLSWFGIFGFVTFIIVGHLYKIIPFLVWYERFSIHVGKKKVPMLTDMVPTKSANFQFFINAFGTLLVALGIYMKFGFIFKIGVVFLVVGAIIFIKDIFYMINFKESGDV